MALIELHQQVDAIQMGTHNICFYKEIDKKNTVILTDCELTGVCAVITSQIRQVF